MRFNSDAYDKIFPRQAEAEVVESMVENYEPPKDETVEEEEVLPTEHAVDEIRRNSNECL
jgi:hypothetical protein